MRKLTPLILIFILAFALPLYGGVTGKISGTVIDKDTGEPLPGVNVIIVGTTMGAATTMDGFFHIINVPVGTFSVKASMIGYEAVTLEEAKVSSDLTTTLNFELKATPVEIPGITVTAERPMVLLDATSTTYIATGALLDRQPIDDFQDVIAGLPGVVESAGGSSGATGGLHLRGGRADEVAYMVDGMSIKDPITGGAGADVNVSSIEEMAITTGGFNAEYGQAMSGVVNIITKEGRTFEGLARYGSDGVFGGEYDEGRHRIEANIGGPFPLHEKLLYYLSSEVTLRDHQQAYDFVKSNTDRERYSLQGKLTYKITPTMKLNLSGLLTRNQHGSYAIFIGLPGLVQTFSENSFKYVPPEYRRSTFTKAYQTVAALTHQIGTNTFYELKFGYFNTHTILGVRDWKDEEDRNWWEDYEFIDWHYRPESYWAYDIGVGWDAVDEDSNYYYPYGVPNVFLMGYPGYWQERQSEYYGMNFGITSQLTPHHQVKLGLEGKWHTVSRELGQYIGRGGTEDYIYNVEVVNGDTVSADTMTIVPGDQDLIEASLYFDVYDDDYDEPFKSVHPREAAFYIQDKIEYPGFIANAGLRVDYFDANTWRFRYLLYPRDPVTGELDTTAAEVKWQVSPRLGISFPVTERSVFHIAYGHFFQMSRMQWLYDNYNTALQEKPGGWGRIGNPNLEAQKTIQYEIGLSHQFTENTALHITTFYKDLYNIIGTRFFVALPDPYSAYVTDDYGNVKGVEFVFQKRATQYLSGSLSYTLSKAEGTASYTTEAYYDYIANVPVDPYTGEPFVLPKRGYPLEFDQRHTLNCNLDFLIPDGFGPVISGVRPFQNINLNSIISASSGLPYTERDSRNYLVGETNAKRLPWIWNVGLRVAKDFSLFGRKLQLFTQITNLFNIRNTLNVYPNTGIRDNNEMVQDFATYMDQNWLTVFPDDPEEVLVDEHWTVNERRDLNNDGWVDRDEFYQSYVDAYTDYMTDPYMSGSPRHINVGVSIRF